MSPALIDSGLRSQVLPPAHANRGQIPSPLISSAFLRDDRVSAFHAMSRPDDVSPNFQFSAASMSRPVPDKAAFGAIQGLSRPRMAKTRKSQHNRVMAGPEPRKFDAPFNRFRGVDLDYSGESVVNMADDGSSMFGTNRMSSGLNANKGSDNLGSSILDEIRNLRLRDEGGAWMDISSPSVLDGMKRLNMEDAKQREASITSSKHFNASGNSQNNVGFGRGGDGGDGLSFGAHGNHHFEFGNRKMESSGVASGMTDAVTHRMRNLEVKSDSDNANEKRAFYNEKMTTGLSNRSEGSQSGGEPHSMLLDDLGKLKLGDDLKESEGVGEKSIPDGVKIHNEGLSSVEIKTPQHQANDGTQSKHQFVFTSKVDSSGTPYGEFNSLSPKGNLFTSFNQRVDFGTRRETIKNNLARKVKVKSKESPLTQPWGGANFSPKESSFQYAPEPSESYSPMEVSPYRDTQPDNQSFRKTSLTSEESVHLDENLTSNDHQSAYGDMVDEVLISATERLGIYEGKDMKFDEGADQVSTSSLGVPASSEESVSAVATESFKSAKEFSEISGQNEEVSSRLNDEAQSRDETTQFFSASSSESTGEIPFTFSAPFSIKDHVAPQMRNQKKKNRTKVGQDQYNSLKDTLLSDVSSTIHFTSISRGSSPFNTKNEDLSTYCRKEGPSLLVEKAKPAKQETPCPSTADFAAKEACEKWRLRGNQAYSSGDLDKAEDYYTQGLNCISKREASRDGLKALMLCYSNRAAIRMALGRFRDALADCRAAAEIDPEFYKVQLRTANCHLALGEVAEASGLLLNLLQLGTEACTDRKVIVEASESIQKAQKVSKCIDHSAELLQHKTLNSAEDSLRVIGEGLAISPHSEKLLQMKAEALFMMQRYQEVIQFCEQTLRSAEKNFPLVSNNQSSMEPSEVLNKFSFRIWRYSFIFNSYYYLGKLEEGLDFLEKQTDLRSVTDRCGTQVVESLIPLLVPARELVKNKSAGNAAYQAGKHAEAVEHYTAALACNAESRTFAAICFGNRAAAYQALGQIPDAIADCNLAIALDRNYFKAISRRATLFEMIRDYEEAANDLRRLVSVLAKQAEEKANRSGPIDRSVKSQADMKQAHMRLAHVEEQAIKEPLLDFYVILGVDPSATSADLKKAYRKAALRHHPDKACQLLTRAENVDDGLWKEMTEEIQKESDRLFKMIGEAYSVLSNPTKRLRYEEEVRDSLKKTGGMGTSRMRTDGQSYGYQRNSSGRTAWNPPGNPPNQWFEPSRSSRFH